MRNDLMRDAFKGEKRMTRSRKQVAPIVILTLVLGLLVGFSTIGAVDTTVAITTVPASGFVVGQSVTVTWTLTAQTTSTVAFDGILSVRIKSPGSATWDIFTDNVATSGGSFSTNHTFIPTKAGDYVAEGNYAGCATCDPVLNASPLASATISVSKAETTVSVTSDKNAASPGPPVTGEAVTLTATVGISPACATCTTPTGTVTFYADAVPIGTVAVSGAGTASLTTSFNAVDHPVSITATYNGDSNYNASPTSAAYSQNVYQADTIVTITSVTPTPSVVGQAYVVSGTVTPANTTGTHTTTGTVQVSDGTDTCTDTTLVWNASGYWDWSCSLTSMSDGASKTITATFNPSSVDTNYATSSDTASHTVDKAATATSVSSSANPSVTGQSVTFTATVSAVSPGTGTPTGTVTFYKGSVGGDVIDSPVGLNGSGQATVITTFDANESPVSIYARYNGDLNYNTSDSAVFTQNVNRASTTVAFDATTITALGIATDVGESYTVSGTVAVNLPGSGTPSGSPTTGGTVEVSDGTDTVTILSTSLTWGTPEASKWNWSCSFTSTTAGAKTITATYSGDAKYQPSSDTELHTVDKADTTVAITTVIPSGGSDGDPSVVGQSYTVSGTVAVDSPGNAMPSVDPTTTGNVQVSNGADTITILSTSLVWGNPVASKWNWSCSFTSATAGDKTITATYMGDANYKSDTTLSSGDVVHTVDPADTAVTITTVIPSGGSDGNPSVVGQSYTVSGTVAVDSPGNAMPSGAPTTTGTVEVSDGTDTCTDTTLVWNDSGYWDWSCALLSTTVGDGTSPCTNTNEKTLTATFDPTEAASTPPGEDPNYAASSTTACHVVNPASTTTEVSSSVDPSVTGESVTFTATVTPVAPGSGTPADGTNLVEFSYSVHGADSWTSMGSANLSAGTASLGYTLPGVGSWDIKASYDGSSDDNYGSSDNSAALFLQTVNKADTTVTITTDTPDPSVVGETYTISGTVTVDLPGQAMPSSSPTTTGTVDVSDGTSADDVTGISLSWDTDHWDWTCSFTASTAGVKTLTAVYSGDADYNEDTDTDSHTVNKAATTTVIISDTPDPTYVDAPYTVSGTVTPANTAGPHATTGTVVVSDGTDSVTIPGTDLAWASGHWNWTTDSLCGGSPPCYASTTPGPKTITATYSGDTEYSGSSGTKPHNTVEKGTVSIAVTPSTWTSGGSGSFTATLTVTSGSGTPSGTVTFHIEDYTGSTIDNSGPHTLSGDSATSDPVTLTAGQSPVSVTATYSGDTDFSSNSGSTSVTVYADTDFFEITGDNPDPSASGETYTVTWGFRGGYAIPTGAYVILSDDAGTPATSGHIAATALTGNLTSTDTAVTTVTADLYDNETDNNLIATDSTAHTVVARETATAVTGSSDAACISQPVLLTATVTDLSAPPDGPGFTGTVTWASDGDGTFDPVACDISQGGQCDTYYTPVSSDVGTVNVTASYSGDDAYGSSVSPDYVLHIGKRDTNTTVFGSDTPLVVGDTATFLVTVRDTSNCVPTIPTGDVLVTVSPSGDGILIGESHTLVASDGGQFTFTYTPTSNADTSHEFTATYAGSAVHFTSSGTFAQEIIGRAADIQMSIAPPTTYIYQPVTIAIHVEDDTTAGALPPPGYIPTGMVTLTDDGSGVFDHADGKYALDGNGDCNAVYTPNVPLLSPYDDPLKTITATYSGSNLHAQASTVGHLNVNLRPTTTTVKFATSEGILVNEHTTFTVTVADAAGVAGTVPAPGGTIGIKKSLEPKSEGILSGPIGPFTGSGETQWVYGYYRTALDSEGGENDTITATYIPNDGIHTGSNGPYGKSISRRPTVTTISNAVATSAGIIYTVEVVEDSSNNGTPVTITNIGDFIEKGGTSLDETKVGDAPGPVVDIAKDVDDPGHTLLVNVTVHYEPNDRVHLTSLDSETVDRSEFIQEDPPIDPSNDGSSCTDGCGDGGTNVDQILFNMRSAVVALQATQMGLDTAAIVASLFPNPVVTVGIIFESGAEIPAKDIVIAVFDGANLLLEVAIMAMEVDLDGDGLPDTVENTVTHTEYNNPDSDGDGMGDYDEISYCGGYYGGTLRPNPNIPDSDSDGLLDGYELAPFYTDVCVTDTDCDTLPDGVEVACRTAPTAGNGFDETTFAALGYSSFIFPDDFIDERDQPNPREADTDGDGLRDDIEFGPGVVVATSAITPYSPYVNDADSDGDGILDGNESTNGDAVWDYTQVGGTGTTGSGETHLCLADTDGDGLLDGEEEALFGRGGIEVHSTLGTITTPALDDDSDDDGLSDYEEQVVTGTDPLNWDTDNDGISDADELIATSGIWPARSFIQSSDPLDPDTDDDGLTDYIEYGNNGVGTGLGTLYPRLPSEAVPAVPVGNPDTTCPLVNDDDSDDDGLQDGTESWNGDDIITTGTIGDSLLQADTPGDAYSHTTTGETDFCDPDTDGDGLTDGEEVALLGGLPVSSTTGFTPVIPQGVSTVFGQDGPNLTATIPALDDDSDNDGLSDYEEVNITGTDPLDADSDNDTLSDANELIATGGTWPNRTFIQESDPLDPDTDDDDLYDQIEYPGSGLGTSRGTGGTPDNICPYVNDDDSDDDGLQDGYEDDDHDGVVDPTDHDGIWNNYTLGNSGSPGRGETCACNPDTDRDGLSDGEEEGLIARSSTWQLRSTEFAVAGLTSTASTVPALDDDSDNDGLSDYEEVDVTHTDPLDADSDDDTLSDANELIALGTLSLVHADGGALTFVPRQFQQESDPLDPDTDDDDLFDYIEYPGSGLGTSRTTGGDRDNDCPYVNDADSDDDGLQDGTEDANHDGTWGVLGSGITVGSFATQASKTVAYWECNLCNPDTDGDGLLDGEEVALIGGGPTMTSRTGADGGVPVREEWGFDPVTPQAVSTQLPYGTSTVPTGYTHTPDPSPRTQGSLIAPYMFDLHDGTDMTVTIPALDVDSDNDGLSDYEEVNITGTDPLDQDTDNDTLMDSDELIATGGTPGPTPRRTFDQESDPLDINTDDDHLFDPQEYYDANAVRYGSGLSILAGATGGVRDLLCPFVNDDDSDDDSIQDGAVVSISPPGVIRADGTDFSYTHYEDFIDLDDADQNEPVVPRTVPTLGDGEQSADMDCDVCDADSDDDGLLDGEEIAIGTDPDDYDTDDDGRNDWHEVTGGGPIPTDPFDPDTDDDGLLDSVEVYYLSNTTNPTNADTDGDGLCDGGTGTPWMKLYPSDLRVVVNPICKSCSDPGLTSCGTLARTGSVDGIGDHPNPHGYGEDKNGNGQWDGAIGDLWTDGEPGSPETDPNQYDTDGDAEGDGIEVLGFSTSRQSWIPTTDLFGRTINVPYPTCGCLEPLIADTDGDGLEDGYEDNNHDGNFDFLPSDFDYAPDPLPGPPQPNPNETNPCNPDTDNDGLTDYEERYQAQVFELYANWDNDGDGLYNEDPVDGIDNDGDGLIDEDPVEPPFNPTNPLDHDTDNDWLLDGFEVKYKCVAVTYTQLDNDGDALIDEDPIDGLDNDGDGLIDEDPVDFFVRFVPMLDPTCRDSDSDGWIDGLDDDPCNSELIPLLPEVQIEPIDTDGDGFADDDELMAGTHPNDPEDYPVAYCKLDLDFDQAIDDRMWLERRVCCGIANSVVIDIDSNVLIDARVQIVAPRDVKKGDFDGDGFEDDYRYVVEYAFSNYRVVQPRILLTIDDYNGDLTIDHAEVVRK